MGHVPAIAKPGELVAVIRKVAEGEDPLRDEVIGRPDLIDRLMEGFRESFRLIEDAPVNPLTPRELDVLRHVAAGMRNRQIGEFSTSASRPSRTISRASCTSSVFPTGCGP